MASKRAAYDAVMPCEVFGNLDVGEAVGVQDGCGFVALFIANFHGEQSAGA